MSVVLSCDENARGVGVNLNRADGCPSEDFSAEYSATSAREKSQLIHLPSLPLGVRSRTGRSKFEKAGVPARRWRILDKGVTGLLFEEGFFNPIPRGLGLCRAVEQFVGRRSGFGEVEVGEMRTPRKGGAQVEYHNGNYDTCLTELAQCGAVILRMMEFVRKEKEARQ